MDLKQLCNHVIDLVKQVGSFISNEQGDLLAKSIESKGKHNFVTYIDKEAEKQLVYQLKKLVTKSGFIVEEGTSTIKGKIYNWIVDPLDGTTNFIHSAPPYAISIALMEGAEIVLGVVYEITKNECFYSYKGSNVFLNDMPIQVSTVNKVSDTLIATGFPYSNFSRLNSFMKSLEFFFNNSHGVRRLGSAAADLAYVACGRYDAFYEYNLNAWDVAAGAFLVQQAGGRVSDFSGGSKYLFGKEIVASNNAVFDEFQQVIGRFMNK
jgi:myo-inositol-1(or 4)-monophosphatase